VGDRFYLKYKPAKIDGLPKYAQLREALRAAIEDGYYSPGSQLPPETELVRVTPFSLGTVQKALKTLVEEGVVIRRQGHGSFVAENTREMDKPWHCRFASDVEGSFLPVYPKVFLLKKISSNTWWRRLLNKDTKNIIQIDRLADIGHEFFVYIKFFLNGDKFDKFLQKPIEDLERSNFKTILRQEYNLPTTHMSYTLRVTELPAEISRAIKVAKKTIGLVYEIVASSGKMNPVYYQEIYIPPNKRKLYISDSSNIPLYWSQDIRASKNPK
jgi:GntR family transcriptional regulator